jgi:hypothetical protein
VFSTAATADGKLATAYILSTSVDSRTLTIEPGQFSGPVAAWWNNPMDRRLTRRADLPLANRGSHLFQTPRHNDTKANNWPLILEVH